MINVRQFIEDNFKTIFVSVIFLKVLLLIFIIQQGWFSWDKNIWYDAVLSMRNAGVVPYINNFEFTLGITEYPIVFTYFLLLFYPFIYVLSNTSFFLVFGLVQILADVGITILLYKMLKDKTRILFGFMLMPTVLLLSTSRFDLLPSFFVVLLIYYFSLRRDVISGMVCSIASFLKIYPGMFILAFYKKVLKRKKFIFSFLFVSLILNWFIFLNFKSLFLPFTSVGSYRAESFFGLLGLLGVTTPYADMINMGLLVVLLLYAFFMAKTNLGRFVGLIIPLLLTSMIFSPQWNLWFLPLLVLSSVPLLVVFLFDLITIIEFPFVWGVVFGSTGFDPAVFDVSNWAVFLFVVLNFLRYGFFLYFYFKAVHSEKFVNPLIGRKLRGVLEE